MSRLEKTFSIKKAIALSWLFLIFTLVSQLLITRIITINYGLEVYGIWAIVMSIQAYLFIADSGLSSSVTTYANIFETRKESFKVKPLITTNISLLTIIFSVVLVISFLISGIYNSSEINWRFIITITVLNVYILSIVGVFSNFLIAFFEVPLSKLFQIINVLILTVLVIFFATKTLSIEYVISALAISSSIYLFTLVLYTKNKYPKIVSGNLLVFDKKIFKETYKFIANTFIIAVASRVQFYTDVLIIGFLLGLTQAGIYEINNKIPFYATYLSSSFVVIFYPFMTSLFTRNNFGMLRTLYFSIQYLSIIFAVSISLILLFYVEILLEYWIDSNIYLGTVIFSFMLISLIFHTLMGPIASLFQAVGKNKFLMKLEVIIAISNISLSLYLIKPYGLLGVILGTVISQFGGFLFLYPYLLRTILKVKLKELIKEVLAPLVLSLAILFFIFYKFWNFWKSFDNLTAVIFSAILITIIVTVVFLTIDYIFYKLNFKKNLVIDIITKIKQYS